MHIELRCGVCQRRQWISAGQDWTCTFCQAQCQPTGRVSDPALVKAGHKDAARPGRGKGPRLNRAKPT